MGAKFSGMIFGERSSRVRNQRVYKQNHILQSRRNSNNNPQQADPAQYQQIPRQISQTPRQISQTPQQPQTRSLMNKIRGKEVNTNQRQLKIENKQDIFSLLNKNTTFILQRHATSCANIINKGFKTGSTSYLTFGKSRFVAEIAPDSMLSSVGIDECNQVHDYLTNIGTEIIQLDKFEHLFCCSELFRTQQTMFLSYFELIHSKNIRIMILPWLNEERAIDTFGGINKDNLTISLKETKKRWKQFIEEQILKFPLLEKLKIITHKIGNSKYIPGNKMNKNEKDKFIAQVRQIYNINGDITIELIEKKIKEEKDKYSKFLDWNNVFYLPNFIYRNPIGLEATFDKRVDLEKLYKIKMEESKILTEPGKQSYNADDLLFALPFILYLSKTATVVSHKKLKIFMTGHSRTMVKLINLITLRSASNLDLRSKPKKASNFFKGVKMITGEESPYYSKPSLEKQQMMNAEIIQLEPVNLIRVFGGRDKFEKFEHLNSTEINDLSNASSNNNNEIINTNFNSCRKFPVGFSEKFISKQIKSNSNNELEFKSIHPFYFFYNSNLGIVYSLVDSIEQKIKTSNAKLYKEEYPLRVFFGMTLLQYVGYLMVAKAVVSEMKEKFIRNPKYDYQGLLDNISKLKKKINEYVGDIGNANVNVTQNFLTNQPQPEQPQPQPEQPQPNASQNSPLLHPNANKLAKLDRLIIEIIKKGFQQENQNLNGTSFKTRNETKSFTIRNIIDNYLNTNNIDSIDINNIDKIIIGMLTDANIHKNTIDAKMKTYTKYWFCNKLYQKYTQRPSQTAGQNSSTAIKYMEKNATEYFEKKAKQFPKYSITIKQFLFNTLLEHISDRQEKRKEFVRLLHTSLLSTCNIQQNQQKQNKITNFMKNSFPTGLLEQESQTPTRGDNEQGQGMLERVQKLNEKIGSYLLKDSGYLIVPFIPLSSDGQNQLDKIIEHMKKMGGFYLEKENATKNNSRKYNKPTKESRANEIYIDLNDRTGIYSSSSDTPLLKLMYPSINDSVGRYIVGMIYKILITYTNYNLYYSQLTIKLFSVLIIIYINYGIQYLLDFLKKAYIIFSVIENFTIPDIINRILRPNKKNYSLLISKYIFFSDMLISTDIEAPYIGKVLNKIKSVFTKKKRNYSIEEKILHVKRYYYYVSYFYNEDVKKYYEKYGLIFLYFSLYIPDLIYYISDNKDFNKNITNVKNEKQHEINYAKKIQYLFKLSDYEIKNKSIAVIDEFLPKLIDYIKSLNSNNYDIIGKSNINLNIYKLYDKIMGHLFVLNREQYEVNKDDYSTNNSTNNSKKNDFEKNFNEIIKLITEPVHFESNEKAFATISGIPTKFDTNLVSPHFFAFEFNLYKIKEVCLKGLMKFSKKDCIQFVKTDISNIIDCVKQLFKSETTDIWKYFVEIHIRLIKEGYVFASQEVKTLIYISRLFGSSFDGILEIFYQSFPYMMFCFEYITKIASDIYKILIPPCQTLNELFDTIGLEKMIIIYKYLNITNIEVMEYIKKYGIIFLIYALLTPFHMFQTELADKNIILHKQIIIDKLKAMYNVEIVNQVKSAFDDKKIVEFIQKVEENKNDIFGKAPVAQNNSNINLNLTKFSNNGHTYNGIKRPQLPNMMINPEPNRQNSDFIWSVFTIPFVPLTVEGNRNVLDEIIAFYKTEKVGETKKRIIDQIKSDYDRRIKVFDFIKNNYLKDDKIEYNSYWKIIAEDYGNLNIEYGQSAAYLIYVSLFYRYNKLEFFKNIYLVNSLFNEEFNSYRFIKYILRASDNNSANMEKYKYYLYVSLKFNLFAMIFNELRAEIWNNESNLNKIKLFLYYIIEYNNDDVKIYYDIHGLIFLYFSYCIPSLIFFHYTKDNLENYNKITYLDMPSLFVDYLLNLSDEDIKIKSKIIIDTYIIDYKKYIMSLNNVNIRNISSNKNINKKIEYNKNGNSKIINMIPAKNGSVQSVAQSTKPFNLHKTLLMERVYFAT